MRSEFEIPEIMLPEIMFPDLMRIPIQFTPKSSPAHFIVSVSHST